MTRVSKLFLPLVFLAFAALPAHGALIPFSATIDGAQSGTGSTATGSASLIFDDVASTFDLDLSVSGIAPGDLINVGPNSTPLHLHIGAVGVNGPIIAEPVLFGVLSASATGFTLVSMDVPIVGVANIAALLAGDSYLNIHTAAFPPGEVRGQVIAVAEPAALALFALGLAGLGLMARRRPMRLRAME